MLFCYNSKNIIRKDLNILSLRVYENYLFTIHKEHFKKFRLILTYLYHELIHTDLWCVGIAL